MKNLLLIGIALFSFYTIKAQTFIFDGINYRITSPTTVEVIANYPQNLTEIEIPSTVTNNSISYTVTSIGGEAAFRDWIELKTITLPNTLTNIGFLAFVGCKGLTSINIPSSVTNIGSGAFVNCESLTTFNIPNTVTSLGGYVFQNCKGLTSVSIPNSITHLWTLLFEGCTGLTSIILPNSIETIGDEVFKNCTGLTSIIIPNSVTSLGEKIFENCSNLHSITIGSSITNIGKNSFFGCTGLTSIDIPNTVKSIEDFAFYKCINLSAITFGNSLTSIGNNSFYQCSKLESIDIPNSLTSIGDFAFYECTGIKSLKISSSITNIGNSAFERCSGLTSITCNAITPPTLGWDVFRNVDKTIPLIVPTPSIELYKATFQWKDFNVQDLSTVNTSILKIKEFKVYPNPASKNLTIEIDNPANLTGVSIKVLNTQSAVVHNEVVTNPIQTIDVSSWSPGIYFLQIVNGNSTVETRKIIVNK